MELLAGLWFLIVGIAGCVYPFMEERNVRFNKSEKLEITHDNPK